MRVCGNAVRIVANLRQFGTIVLTTLFLNIIQDIGNGGKVSDARTRAPVPVTAPELAHKRPFFCINDSGAAITLDPDATSNPRFFIVGCPGLLDEPLSSSFPRAILIAANIGGDIADLSFLVTRSSAAGEDNAAWHNSRCGIDNGLLDQGIAFAGETAKEVCLV